MSTIRTTNNPQMLAWAREEIGFSPEQAAEAIGVSVETLLAAEAGDKPLTLNQLRNAAEKYDFPFGYFYLSEPPSRKSFEPVPDFRIEPSLIGSNHYRLNLEIRKSRVRRELFLDLASTLDMEIKRFEVLPERYPENVGSIIRERLDVKNTDLLSLDYDDVYAYWKGKIENDGVLVYESQYIPAQTGVLGAALFYEAYPIILIKRGGGFNERRLFTLLHEYAHLLKGKSAINDAGAQLTGLSGSSEAALESACNYLAAEILVPSKDVNAGILHGLNIVGKMESLAKSFRVTYTTAAVCLRRLNLISNAELNELLEIRRKANEKKAPTVGEEVKIPRENIMRLDLGKPMFNTVLEAYSAGLLDIYDTSKILNLRVKKIDRLLERLGR